MGGIKNRLSKLIYEPPFRKRGVVPVALRVGVPLTSQRYDETSQRYDDSRYNNRISIGGFDRVPKFTKYTSMACLTLAILSTLVLNIVSSYSSSKVNSNAEPVGNPSVLANDSTCDPNNTNAPSCISLSITSSSSTGGNDPNLSLSIPRGGGLVAGRHTVSVKSNNINGYQLRVEAASGIEEDGGAVRPINLELTHNDGSVDKEHAIPSLTQNNDKNVNYGNTMPIENNTWGIAIPDSSLYGSSYDDVSVYESYITNPRRIATAETAPKFAGMYTYDPYSPSTRGVIVDNSYTLDEISTATPADGNSLAVYYGVRVDNPNELLAGNYQAEVVYTATVNLPPTPTNLSVSPATFEFDSCNDSLITIKGNNLSSAYEVYLQKSGTSDEANRLTCTNLNLDSTNNQLTCNIPTSRDEVELNTTYDIYVISQAASPGILKNAFTYTEPATGISVKSTSENIIVDYDENLIPVIYVGYDGDGSGHWESLTKSEIADNTDNWFNYTNKQWANAVTVTKDSLSEYQDKHTTIDNNDVLGYWVYIPRYAYEVMRPNAVDKVVNGTTARDEGGFDIHFETVSDTKKIPAASCNLGISTATQMWANGAPTSSAGPTSANILAKDYRTGCDIDRTYPGNDATKSNGQTTWATHSAFTWGDTELNGLWVGKFETTGKLNAPTVKPNQHANISEYIGEFSTMAKSIGKEDKCNVGGNTISGIEQNSHNLQTTKSHMLKNSEWGAVAYLSASKYGTGVNGTQINSAYPSSSADADGTSSRYGITGCGPYNASDSTSTYTDGTALSSDLIESPTACSQNIAKAYNGSIGILASTTNNIYGIYDMSGGVHEYVMGNLTGYDDQSETSSSTYMTTQAKPPYVDLYKESPYGNFTSGVSSGAANNPVDWGAGTYEYYWNNDICTWETCGGHALHETKQYQSVSSVSQSWGSGRSSFVYSSLRWFLRGGYAYSGSSAGLFYSLNGSGYDNSDYGFRSALLALPAGQ